MHLRNLLLPLLLLLLSPPPSAPSPSSYDAACDLIVQHARKATQLQRRGDLDGANAAVEDAVASFEGAAAMDDSNAQAYLNIANVLLNVHRFEASLERWDQALDRVRKDPALDAATRQQVEAHVHDRSTHTRLGLYSTRRDAAYKHGAGNITAALRWAEKQLGVYGHRGTEHLADDVDDESLPPVRSPAVLFDAATMRVMQAEVGDASARWDTAVRAAADFREAQASALHGAAALSEMVGFTTVPAAMRQVGRGATYNVVRLSGLERDARARTRRVRFPTVAAHADGSAWGSDDADADALQAAEVQILMLAMARSEDGVVVAHAILDLAGAKSKTEQTGNANKTQKDEENCHLLDILRAALEPENGSVSLFLAEERESEDDDHGERSAALRFVELALPNAAAAVRVFVDRGNGTGTGTQASPFDAMVVVSKSSPLFVTEPQGTSSDARLLHLVAAMRAGFRPFAGAAGSCGPLRLSPKVGPIFRAALASALHKDPFADEESSLDGRDTAQYTFLPSAGTVWFGDRRVDLDVDDTEEDNEVENEASASGATDDVRHVLPRAYRELPAARTIHARDKASSPLIVTARNVSLCGDDGVVIGNSAGVRRGGHLQVYESSSWPYLALHANLWLLQTWTRPRARRAQVTAVPYDHSKSGAFPPPNPGPSGQRGGAGKKKPDKHKAPSLAAGSRKVSCLRKAAMVLGMASGTFYHFVMEALPRLLPLLPLLRSDRSIRLVLPKPGGKLTPPARFVLDFLALVLPDARGKFIKTTGESGAGSDGTTTPIVWYAQSGAPGERVRISTLHWVDWPHVVVEQPRPSPPAHALAPRSLLRNARLFLSNLSALTARASASNSIMWQGATTTTTTTTPVVFASRGTKGASGSAVNMRLLRPDDRTALLAEIHRIVTERNGRIVAAEAEAEADGKRRRRLRLVVFHGGKGKGSAAASFETAKDENDNATPLDLHLGPTQAARLFRDATAVVGIHGGALSNLLFCRPGTLVLEIGFRTVQAQHYAHASAALGLRYHLLLLNPDERSVGAPVVTMPSGTVAQVGVMLSRYLADEDGGEGLGRTVHHKEL